MTEQAITIHEMRVERVRGARKVRLRVDIGPLEWVNTASLAGFNERLLSRLPGLTEHECIFGQPGGLLRRLIDGTYVAHVVEHVALELQRPENMSATRCATRRVAGRAGLYDIAFACFDETSGYSVAKQSLQLVESLLPIDYLGARGSSVLGAELSTLNVVPKPGGCSTQACR